MSDSLCFMFMLITMQCQTKLQFMNECVNLNGIWLYGTVHCGRTCGPCAWLVDSHDRLAGHRSHRTASAALVCGCRRTLASETTQRGPLENNGRIDIWLFILGTQQ